MIRNICCGLGVMAVLLISSPSYATLLGDDINGCAYYSGYSCGGDTFSTFFNGTSTVGPGVEFQGIDGVPITGVEASADFQGTTFTLTAQDVGGYMSPTNFLCCSLPEITWDFTGLDWLGGSNTIQSVELLAGNGLSVVSLTYGIDWITLMTGPATGPCVTGPAQPLEVCSEGFGQSASFAIHSATVPEPATLALFGIGLAGLVFLRRRKRIE